MRRTASFPSTAFLLIALIAALFTTDAFAQALSLEKPAIGSSPSAAKQAGENAFPEGEVGLAAYVQVQETVDIGKIAENFGDHPIAEMGSNYIRFQVGISNSPKAAVDAYADSEGWIIAYLVRNELATKALYWSYTPPAGQTVSGLRTTLSDALTAVGNALGLAIHSWKLKYYHFRYPEANRITLVRKKAGFKQILFPPSFVLYELSYLFTSTWSGNLAVDDQTLHTDPRGGKRTGLYPASLYTPNVLHRVVVSGENSHVASMLIYREQ